MNTRDEIVDVFDGHLGSDLPPPAIFTQTGTVDLMDACGAAWPEANFDQRKMAILALQPSRLFSFATARVPYCLTVEAEGLGAVIDPGRRDSQPSVKTSPYRNGMDIIDPPDFGITPDEFADRGRCLMVAEVAGRLSSEGLFTTACTVDPAFIAMSLVGAEEMIMGYLMDPDRIIAWADALGPYSCAYAKRLSEAADNVLVVASASLDLFTPEMYSHLAENQVTMVVHAVKSSFCTIHSCGDTRQTAASLSRSGADALSLEASSDPGLYMEKVGGRCLMVGSVRPAHTLLMGSPEDVRSEAAACAEEGFDIIAPECGVPPRTPNVNLDALAHYRG